MTNVTVTNTSQKLILVGERYLFPGESREVAAALVNCDDKRLLCVQDDGDDPADGQQDGDNELPADLPGRDALIAAGLTTVEAVLAQEDDLTQIENIGKATAEKIAVALAALEAK